MPLVQREATILLTTEELSKALGIAFDQVSMVEWWDEPGPRPERKGLRIKIRMQEELRIGKMLKEGKRE